MEAQRGRGAPPKVAAKCVVDGTHRLASEAEIAQSRLDRKRREEGCASAERMNKSQSSPLVSTAMVEAIRKLDVSAKETK
jgi:hypothetical protein